jgi:hypothetical protein
MAECRALLSAYQPLTAMGILASQIPLTTGYPKPSISTKDLPKGAPGGADMGAAQSSSSHVLLLVSPADTLSRHFTLAAAVSNKLPLPLRAALGPPTPSGTTASPPACRRDRPEPLPAPSLPASCLSSVLGASRHGSVSRVMKVPASHP